MPETPDFDQIAKSLLLQVAKDLVQTSLAHNHVVEQLRLVWNARGAADIVKMESTLLALLDHAVAAAEPSTPLVTQIDHALRSLDR